MKTLEEIKEEYAIKIGFEDWIDMLRNTGDWVHDTAVDMISKEYAKEVAREALRNASENAKAVRIAKDGSWSSISPMIRTAKALHYVDKQSILNESNIPEL